MFSSVLTFIAVVAAAAVVGLGFLLALTWRRVVPTNMVHIVQSAKQTISYGKGKAAGNVYYQIPQRIPKFGVAVSEFPLSVFDLALSSYEAYDIGRLPFVVDVIAYFRIDDSDTAAGRVESFSELKEQLLGVLQGAVRRVLAINELEVIMEDRAKLGQQFTDEVNKQLMEWGVTTVKTIEFMDIRDTRDSQVIHNIMAKEKSRIEKESRETVAENMKLAESKEIESRREVDLSRVDAERAVGIREAEREKEVGIAKEKSHQDIQSEQKTTMQRMMEVREVESVRTAEIERSVAEVAAAQDREVRLIRADTERDETIRVADGNLQSTMKEAEGITAVGTARAETERLMLRAPVDAQITLAKEIGENDSYQRYLLDVRRIEATEAVGKEMAGALETADLKVIANSGSITGGVASLADALSPAGGTSIAGMIEALSQTESGKALVDGAIERLTPINSINTNPPGQPAKKRTVQNSKPKE